MDAGYPNMNESNHTGSREAPNWWLPIIQFESLFEIDIQCCETFQNFVEGNQQPLGRG